VWFDAGVVPAAKTLRWLAESYLGDKWRVSELAEYVVHKLAARHGDKTGEKPWRQVIVWAQWEVLTLKAGSRWLRRHRKSCIPLENIIDRSCLQRAVEDENALICRIMLDGVDERISERAQYQKAFRLLRAGYTWDDIETELGLENVASFKQGFYHFAKLCAF
jgi:hypothetical protein